MWPASRPQHLWKLSYFMSHPNTTIMLQNILAGLLPDPLFCQTNPQFCCDHSTKRASPLCSDFSNSSQGPGQMIHVWAAHHHPMTPLCLKQNLSSTFSKKPSLIQLCQQMLTKPCYVYRAVSRGRIGGEVGRGGGAAECTRRERR